MNADLYLKIYQQQERELEQRLLRRLAAQGRPSSGRARHGHAHRVGLRLHRPAAHG